METLNYLLGYKDYYIYQDTEMFHFSLDSVLLPHFVSLRKNTAKILDIGCGNAPIPLLLSMKTKAEIIGVEIQEASYQLACKSVEKNGLSHQISIIHGDINTIYKMFSSDSFDTITCNPPFFKVFSESKKNQNDFKTIARHEVALTIDQVLFISKYLLKEGGNLAIVHRPERLLEIFLKMKENHLEPKRIQFVYLKINQNANMVLIECTKHGKPGLKIEPPIFAHDETGNYTEQIRQYFE